VDAAGALSERSKFDVRRAARSRTLYELPDSGQLYSLSAEDEDEDEDMDEDRDRERSDQQVKGSRRKEAVSSHSPFL